MKRNLEAIQNQPADLVIIGGGVHGLAAAWNAAQRGFQTVLLEKNDFGGAASAGSYKIIHGGLRYLQHLDLRRMRSSIRERRFFMQAAPHLVQPLAFMVPCYGRAIKSPEAMRMALFLNDIISWDRNHGLDPRNTLPRGQILSSEETLRNAPWLPREELRGGAVFYDGQMLHSERLSLGLARLADQAGARIANYAEVQTIQVSQGRVQGIEWIDHVSGREHCLPAKAVLNLAGCWNHLLDQSLHPPNTQPVRRFSKGIQFFTEGPSLPLAFSFESHQFDPTSILQRGARMVFGAPFQDLNFWGTTDTIYEGHPDDFSIERTEIEAFMEEINQALPGLNLKMNQVAGVCGGLRPLDESTGMASNRSAIEDHQIQQNIFGAVTGRGIKYTTSRDFGRRCVDQIARFLDPSPPGPARQNERMPGTDYSSLADLEKQAESIPYPDTIRERLLHHYGSEWVHVQDLDQDPAAILSRESRIHLLPGEIRFAIQNEMAIHLDDVLLRRTSAANPRPPSAPLLTETARFMANALDWHSDVIEQEINRVRKAIPTWLSEQTTDQRDPAY